MYNLKMVLLFLSVWFMFAILSARIEQYGQHKDVHETMIASLTRSHEHLCYYLQGNVTKSTTTLSGTIVVVCSSTTFRGDLACNVFMDVKVMLHDTRTKFAH